MAKQMRTYRIEFQGETRYDNSSREGIAQAGIGIFSDGSWFHALTIQTDPVKAASAARSTNKYAERYTFAPAVEVPYTGPVNKRG